MNIFERIANRLKPDQRLMREEMDLFGEILVRDRAGTPIPPSLNDRHNEKLKECVRRGFVGNELGGWTDYKVR